jgi:hypothetical protein
MRAHTFKPLTTMVSIDPKTPRSGHIDFVCEADSFVFLLSRAEIERLQERISAALAKAPSRVRSRSSSPSATSRYK